MFFMFGFHKKKTHSFKKIFLENVGERKNKFCSNLELVKYSENKCVIHLYFGGFLFSYFSQFPFIKKNLFICTHTKYFNRQIYVINLNSLKNLVKMQKKININLFYGYNVKQAFCTS